MISAWRIVKRNRAKAAFNGEGTRLYGGRWNSPGVAMVYTAGSQSLAALEIVAHLDSTELLERYVVFEVKLDESAIVPVDESQLPRNWRVDPPPAKVRAIGDAWAAARASVVLQVPSVIVPAENNYLLNPRHPGFSRLLIGKPFPFRVDPRLLRRD